MYCQIVFDMEVHNRLASVYYQRTVASRNQSITTSEFVNVDVVQEVSAR